MRWHCYCSRWEDILCASGTSTRSADSRDLVSFPLAILDSRTNPSTVLASLTDLWKSYSVYTGKCHTNDLARHKRYGPVYRDGPNSLSFADPRCLPAIYGARGNEEFRKASWYNVFPQPPGGAEVMLVIRDPEEHRIVKKRMKPLVGADCGVSWGKGTC